jgi:hypothetical protein
LFDNTKPAYRQLLEDLNKKNDVSNLNNLMKNALVNPGIPFFGIIQRQQKDKQNSHINYSEGQNAIHPPLPSYDSTTQVPNWLNKNSH